jgi:hypothetical protein
MAFYLIPMPIHSPQHDHLRPRRRERFPDSLVNGPYLFASLARVLTWKYERPLYCTLLRLRAANHTICRSHVFSLITESSIIAKAVPMLQLTRQTTRHHVHILPN